MNRIGTVVAKEIREALPAMIFFLALFHMLALTKAVSLQDYSITTLRAVNATIGALIVAKAILVIEALPIPKFLPCRLAVHILWKTILYGVVVLLFKTVEEIIPLASKHGGLLVAAKAMYSEVSWPLFGVMALWIIGGLLLYCLASELIREMGSDRVRGLLFGTRMKSPER